MDVLLTTLFRGITLQKRMLVVSARGCSLISVGESLGFLIENIKGITPGILSDIVEKDLPSQEAVACVPVMEDSKLFVNLLT